jgi:ATP-dependent DNA helicase RecQ
VVVSPLISLMQDQAAQLSQMGIPAAVLNSSIAWSDQTGILNRAAQGAYRLIYLSPERLARPETVSWLRRVPVEFFAIDEAHCISEWGHEFRPEYRQLSSLRANFPEFPIAAFTASATQRVRHDILNQLQLRDPHKYILSFYRPNLRYLVKLCDSKTQPALLLACLRAHADENIIVYAPTIAGVEETVDFLAENNIAAVPYHGQMAAAKRQRNQERWMSDEVRVLVGTIAFGLGINKPSVRAVIHLSLPKSVEQYYQEAGRAGRDGLPADCAMLWRKKDAGLLAHFIEAVTDPQERERAWGRYHTIRRFAEVSACRHRQICLHFGEKPKWDSCGACDVCAEHPEWFAETKERKSAPRVRKPAPAVSSTDSSLIEYLREWRRLVSVRDNVPAYIVLHDTALEDLCRKLPSTLEGLLSVTGIGERKAELYGQGILDALSEHRKGARATTREESKVSPAEETRRLLAEGRSFEEIARMRERRLNSVIDLVADMVERGLVDFDENWLPPGRKQQIEEAAAKLGLDRMKPIKDALPEDVSYGEIRLVVSRLKRSNTD